MFVKALIQGVFGIGGISKLYSCHMPCSEMQVSKTSPS